MNIKEYLRNLGINFNVHTHKPVFTCSEAEKECTFNNGIHSKNLFLKDKKATSFFLYVLPFNKKADLKELGKFLQCKLTFANETDLKDILGLTSGSVSVFGLINDRENKVNLVLDKEVYESKNVYFHPNINTETLELSQTDFNKYLKSLNNKIIII